jgi:hypothetical protein
MAPLFEVDEPLPVSMAALPGPLAVNVVFPEPVTDVAVAAFVAAVALPWKIISNRWMNSTDLYA